ncbi:MAG: hypothetical protein ABL881_04770 [Novosphingobium sp.]
MSTKPPVIDGATAAQDAARDWQAVHGDPSIQFIPTNVKIPPQETPGWMKAIGEVLKFIFEPIGKALGLSWPVLQWVLIGLVVLIVLYALVRFLEPALQGRLRRSKVAAVADPGWVPDQTEALALLEDADRLAGEGKFDEATHLLLQRSVQHIAAARPAWVQKASTAREIAALDGLSEGARCTFGLIATRVERSLFALRALGAKDWQAAREAYARFALERIEA